MIESLDLKSPVLCLEAIETAVAYGCQDGKMYLMDIDTKSVYCQLSHKNAITSLCAGPSGTLLSCSADKSLVQWTIEGRKSRTLKGHRGFVLDCATVGDFVVSVSSDKMLFMWDVRTREPVRSRKLEHVAMCLSSFKDQWLLGDMQGHVYSVDRELQQELLYEMPAGIIGLNSQHQYILANCLDNCTRVLQAQQEISLSLPLATGTLDRIVPSMSPNGHYIISGTNCGNTEIYDPIAQELCLRLGGHQSVSNALYLQGQVVTASHDGKVMVGPVELMD